ncbi:MAG: hypothetical protein FJ109_21105, partial [Deltaproteobacteria bacterium]|nr:hypothetical protein [Deltaproteobacteria bacterium]
DECPAGERPLLGGGCQRVVPLAADCPAAPFADVPKSDGQVVYVDALSPCTEGCGAQAAPFSKIGAAVAAVAAGGYVLVQPGAYAEGIVIDKPVHLLGACAATVVLSGEVPVPGQEGEAAGIVVKDTTDVAIAGISVQSKGSGLVIAGSNKVSLSGMDVSGAAKVGVRVNGSEVEATGLWIHDTGTPDSPKGEGRGIDVTGKSTVSFTAVVVDKATDAGVAAAGAVLKLSDCVVRDTRWGEPGDRGIGIRVDAGCAGEMRGVVLERNRTIGLRISGPSSTVQVEGCLVRETLVDSEGVSSSGVQVSGGGEATLVKTVMAENAGDGFLMAEEGTSVMLDSCIVRDGKAEVSGFYGRGIEVMGAGELELVGGLVSGNLNYGLLASGAGTNVRILGSVLADTHANPGEPAVAIGVSVWFGAEVQVSLSVVEENGTGNLAALDPGSQLDVCQVSARNGLAFVDPEGLRGAGIDVSGEGSATVSDSLLENNQGMGVWVHDDGSSVLLDGSVVRGTLAAVAEGTGFGLSASGGAGAHVVASLLVGNSNAGVLATEAGTELVVESSTVRDTVPAVAEGVGRGLELNKGAKVSLSSSLVEGSTEVGVGVLDGGGDLSVDGCIIRDTLDGPLTKEGRGIDVGSGGKATISDSLVEGSVGTGVNVSQEGTELWLINSVVRGTVQGG